MWWDGSVKVMRVVAAIWVGAITIVAVLQGYELVPQLPKLEPFAWVFSLVIIGVDSAGGLTAQKVRRSRFALKEKTERTLMGLLLSMSQNREIRFEELSASVFVPTKWSLFTRALFRRAPDRLHLARYRQFRPGGFPQQSGIRFTPGKGVVGECWRTKRFIHKDLEGVAARWGKSELSEEGFEKLRPSTRQGFSYDEFKVVVAKYSEIAAEPIWHPSKEGKMVGVLTLDRPRQLMPDAEFTRKLDTRETQEQLAGVARVVGDILFPKSPAQ